MGQREEKIVALSDYWLLFSVASLPLTQVEPKEDYSHLPPEQQRKKLHAKVDELDTAVAKAFSDK